MQSENVIVGGLTFGYTNSLLFENFVLRSERPRIVLKGPSGCGKTTLLKLLFGALNPIRVGALPHHDHAALVLQEDALFPWLSGLANIMRFIPVSRGAIEGHPLFPVVSGFIDQPAHAMSFGQRRSVELFRTILQKPDIIYMDEPFNYLDDVKATAFITYLSTTQVAKLLVVTTHRHDNALDAAADTFYFDGSPPYNELGRR